MKIRLLINKLRSGRCADLRNNVQQETVTYECERGTSVARRIGGESMQIKIPEVGIDCGTYNLDLEALVDIAEQAVSDPDKPLQ